MFQSERTTTWDVFGKLEEKDRELSREGRDPAMPAPEGVLTMKQYWRNKNASSIDGLDGLQLAPASSKLPITTRWHTFRNSGPQRDSAFVGYVIRLKEWRFLAGLTLGIVLHAVFTRVSM